MGYLCAFSLFIIKYIIGKIPQVLKIKRHMNRASCLLVQALYAAIHFKTKSNIASARQRITNRGANSGSCTVSNGIVVILYNWLAKKSISMFSGQNSTLRCFVYFSHFQKQWFDIFFYSFFCHSKLNCYRFKT